MTKKKAVTEKTTKQESEATRLDQPLDMSAIRENIAREVGSQAKAMVAETIKGAKAGQCAALKYLFEISGLYPRNGEDEAEPEEDSLSRILLRRLGVPEEEGAEVTSETGEPERASAAAAGDAIE